MTRIDLPLSNLIRKRCQDLGLNRTELVRRCGYKNISKGLRRLDQVYAGEFEKVGALLARLPDALDLPPETVKEAITATTRQIAAEADARWRAAFKPAAYLLGTSNRPSQIWMFGVTGGAERWLKIPLDTSQSPVTYAEQALVVVRETPTVQFFGLTTGFIVNYTPDHAVRFDLEGRPMEALARAYRPGEATLHLDGRAIRPATVGHLLSMTGET
jgi:hypothetical protein